MNRILRLLGFLLLLITLASATLAAPFNFVVFGDNRDGDSVFKDLVTMVNQEKNLAFAVSVGDIVSHGLEDEYKSYVKQIAPLKVKLYHAIGNHDIPNGGGKRFEKYFGPRFYSVNHEGFHLVFLDNAGWRGLGKEQWAWLMQDLATHAKMPMFVFLHKPITDVSGFFVSHVFTPEREAERLADLLKQYDVKMVFGGHIHGYARGHSYGIPSIITGGAGSPLHLPYGAGGFHHYVRVQVRDPQNIRYDVVHLYEDE